MNTHNSRIEILIYLHLNSIDIVAWTFPLSLAKYRVFFKSKMLDFLEKKYSLPLKGMYVSVIFSMNLTYCILALNVILNTAMKDPRLAKKHLSFFCNFPLHFFSISTTPTNYGGIL